MSHGFTMRDRYGMWSQEYHFYEKSFISVVSLCCGCMTLVAMFNTKLWLYDQDEEKKRREERERVVRERRYTLPNDTPSIVVHPSTTAKSGKFDCTVMSLSVLLDYRPDDNKEHTFEV